jgi:diguanylate cyclase (GGDEF)-like protein
MVATQIVTQAVSPDVSVADLAKLAIGDPGFAARVVALANSAAYGLPSRVSDIRQACMLLGVRGLRNVALSLIVSDMVPAGEDADLLLATSLRRAAAARLIAEGLKDRALDDAFTAGLFLEIGALLRARSELAAAASVARMPAAHRPVIERAFGFGDHAEAGAAYVTSLRLPASIIEAVAAHHDPLPPSSHLAKIAWAAERVAGVWEGGDLARLQADATQALLEVGLTAASAADVLARLPTIFSETAATFERPSHLVDLEQLAVDANARLVEMNAGYEQLVRRLEMLLSEKRSLTEELRQANTDLAHLASTDVLTGLPNRRTFDQALARDLSRAERAKTSVSLLILDVDHFKKVNDTHGHLAGDMVLAKVAEVLRACLRLGDVPARYGGEEMVAILVGADLEGARFVAERVRVMLESMVVQCPTGPVRVTASFGVATMHGATNARSARDLIATADGALYLAKERGRNRVVVAK